MGREQSGRGKQIHLCIAMLILLSPLACTLTKTMSTTTVRETLADTPRDDAVKPASTRIVESTTVDTAGAEVRMHLESARRFFAQGDYGRAVKENEKVLSLAGKGAAAEESLFYIGLIYAHPSYPAHDSGRSFASFKRLISDHPGSVLAEQAKTVVSLIQENDKLKGLVDQLNTVIDELKKVDISVDQKKRERAK
jgi:hypothetical protein